MAGSPDIQSILEMKAIKNYCRHGNIAAQKGTCRMFWQITVVVVQYCLAIVVVQYCLC